MSASTLSSMPLVSVIIPCYNQGCFLQEAIDSVWLQAYPSVEIIVVDDGSTDNTEKVAKQCRGVKYIYQPNQGLSAARNKGIRSCKGDFLIFLDADDWLLPDAIITNLKVLQEHDEVAFVSGGHEKIYTQEGLAVDDITEVTSEHYLHLLQGNYIGMHATVMYRRNIFNNTQYDTTLKRCEDYDLYLNIARKHPVYHHTKKIAAYRLHTSNMSSNVSEMLNAVLAVLQRQQDKLHSPAEKRAYRNGIKIWKSYYCKEMYKSLLHQKASSKYLLAVTAHRPYYLFKYLYMNSLTTIKRIVKNYAPAFSLSLMHSMGLYRNYTPAVGSAKVGLMHRTQPFSKEFGYDRGGPIDRYYIEKFLSKEASYIKGRVLEIGDNTYTTKFGGSTVTKSDILHVNDSNQNATLIGDISHAPQIPDNLFDCIILTQTLHLIYNFKGALSTCQRILKPGGVLLLTVPGITPIDQGEWKETWYWSFTDKAMQKLLEECFTGSLSYTNTFGNVYAASAFLYGLGLPEVTKSKLDEHDPHYQVIVAVRAQKKVSV